MNKEEAIKKLKNKSWASWESDASYGRGLVMNLGDAQKIVSQIDEPQKVVIPKIVADWIEECKKNCFSVSYALNRCPEITDRHGFTSIFDQDTFADAWVNGYEIELEKLYTVEIPNPNIIGNEVFVLMKNGFKNIVMLKKFGVDWKKERGFQITEDEIKKDFAWAWDAGFAEEVTNGKTE